MARAAFTIEISGVVQGVGFRPFVHREVLRRALGGWVRNTTTGARMMLTGEEEQIRAFLSDLKENGPGASLIEEIRVEAAALPEEPQGFSILSSEAEAEKTALIPPDLCTCENCLRELYDKNDRRYRYPFLNCTNCGPRYTIIKDVPYDRQRTTMTPFAMCEDCAAEYAGITNRRYHAEPTCCARCGPRLSFVRDGVEQEGDAIVLARALLSSGGILAVKGLGGFHLACMAEDSAAVEKLRERKPRPHKALALMCADVAQAKTLCEIGAEEEALLTSAARPIVLLEKKERGSMTQISENNRIGILLPYTPLHFLLLENGFGPLVMTSANRSAEPMICKNEDALAELSGIADAFLLHDREIFVPCDDSVIFGTEGGSFVRRSRGFVPVPLFMEEELPQILAAGAELKATFALSKGRRVFPGPHIGDLKSLKTYENDLRQIAHIEKLFDIRPEAFVCDLHPDLLSTRYAEERAKRENLPLIRVQHHHAHLASCMADNGLTERVIGVIWDGTGYGEDGTIWGGEFLTGDFGAYQREGFVRPFPLPGGDLAVKEIWRIAIALLRETFPEDPEDVILEKAALFTENKTRSEARRQQESVCFRQIARDVNCPKTSSIGRLFDGVSALLGICEDVTYEGRAAVLLETTAAWVTADEDTAQSGAATARATADEDDVQSGAEARFPYEIKTENECRRLDCRPVTGEMIAPQKTGREKGCRLFDYRPMIREIVAEAEKGTDKGVLAARFINTLAAMATEICVSIAEESGLRKVVLSGGVFLNQYLLRCLKPALADAGLSVFTHHRVSPGDEGLSLGQLMIAAERLRGTP